MSAKKITKETELDKAKRTLADAEKKNLENALKEFNEFIEPWSEKYGVALIPAGEFIGNNLQTRIDIIKK